MYTYIQLVFNRLENRLHLVYLRQPIILPVGQDNRLAQHSGKTIVSRPRFPFSPRPAVTYNELLGTFSALKNRQWFWAKGGLANRK
jgi:hypothetical protein